MACLAWDLGLQVNRSAECPNLQAHQLVTFTLKCKNHVAIVICSFMFSHSLLIGNQGTKCPKCLFQFYQEFCE